MNDDINKAQIKFITFYSLSYICFGIVMSNFTPFLSSLGYDAMQRGILLSTYAITTILFQLAFGVMADKFQTIKKITIVSLLVFAVASALLYTQTGVRFALHLLLMALSGGLLNTLCGLYDTWVLGSRQEISQRLSFIKAFGSIGWALGSFLASYLILSLSYQGMAISIACILLLAVGNAILLKDIDKVTHRPKTSIKDSLALLNDRKYMLLILILFLLYSMVVANNCTVIDKMLSLGASQTQISMKWSLQSILEIPTYLLGVRILRRFQHYHLLQFSACMLIVQFLLFAWTDSIHMMIVLSIFQLFSTPLLLITSKTMIYQLCKPELRGSSQLIALSIFTGLSSLLIPTIAGSLSIIVGVDTTLMCMAFLGISAYILIMALKKINIKTS